MFLKRGGGGGGGECGGGGGDIIKNIIFIRYAINTELHITLFFYSYLLHSFILRKNT